MVMAVRSLDSGHQVTRIGPHCLEETGELAAQQGIQHILVVTDAGMARTQWFAALLKSLRNADLDVSEYRGVSATPGLHHVDEALAVIRSAGCDGVVSLGGGSCHDVAKVAALLARSSASFHELSHEQQAPEGKLPHVAVNTTAGTGAERSGYAFIMEDAGHEHTVIHHALLVPEVAILDPRIHVGMSQGLTAETGLNALAHAVEAYLSTAHTDASDAYALTAIRTLRTHLPVVVRDGTHLEAREAMAEGAYRAAQAFEEAGLGIVDSISLVLSSVFNIGQSSANGIILPHVMQYDALSVEESRAKALCDALGAKASEGEDWMQAAITGVHALKRSVGQTRTLADHGVTWDDLYLIHHAVLMHPFTSRNPKPLDEEGLTQIFLDALQGPAKVPQSSGHVAVPT